MSRSRRKTPIVGHTTCGSEREDKKLWHQRWRTRERTALTSASPEALSAHLPLLENRGQQRLVDGQGWPLLLARQAPGSRHGGSHRQSQGTQPARTRLPEKAPAAQVDEQMKLSFHQHIALFWMIGAPGVFAPVIENAKRPDAGAVMAWGVAIVAVMILFTLCCCAVHHSGAGMAGRMRCRSGSAEALTERGLRRYYQTAFDDGYVPRVMPYVWRIIWTVGGLMAVTAVLPTNTGRPAFDALVVFSTSVSDRRDAAGFRVEAPWPVDSPKSTGAAEMSTSTIEALASALGKIAEEAEFRHCCK